MYTDVKVTGVDSGQLKFITNGGNDVAKDFMTVVGLKLDDEPIFNQAESDYITGKYDAAVDEFNQTMQNTDKAWLKDYCLSKIADAREINQGGCSKAVQAYLAMINKNPKWAAKHKPAIPAAEITLSGRGGDDGVGGGGCAGDSKRAAGNVTGIFAGDSKSERR